MPKGRILAVDDQRYFRELLEGMLVEEGFEVQTASGAVEALRVLERASFDIVLTDLVMPEIDGNELVRRVKQFNPDQDIVVVTGVVDVKTAVDSMKLGASEYLLKPFDRATLSNTLEGVLHRKRLRVEHARLLAENIEYMGERTLIERATALFSFLSVEPLAERIVDGLCVETGAQGGILWIADEAGAEQLRLVSARGLVQVEDEPEVLAISDLPAEWLDRTACSQLIGVDGDPNGDGSGLTLVFRSDEGVSGVVRLTDKLGGERFDSIDQSCAEKFVGFAQNALANALRYGALERRTLEDSVTGAYTVDYFEDAVRNEIEKSNRHGRTFSILKVGFAPLDEWRRASGERAFQEWLADIVQQIASLQRASDLLALDGDGQFLALVPDADALGASLLKRRAAEQLEIDGVPAGDGSGNVPRPALAVATYPADGTQLEGLMRILDERVEQDRTSAVRELELAELPLSECFELLLQRGFDQTRDAVAKIGDLVLGEPGCGRAGGRTLLYASPGRVFSGAISRGLCGAGCPEDLDIAVLSDEPRPEDLDTQVTWVTDRGNTVAPFLIRFGEGPAYALICDDAEGGAGARMFHTADRSLVEHLAFRVQQNLAA